MRRALWFGRTASGVVVAAVVLTAAALASPSASERVAREGGTFRVAVPSGNFNSIDPALSDSLGSIFLLRPTCGSLMSYPDRPPPDGLRLRPELAEADPVVSRDRRTYTFTIRKDARFSDGSPVTARAFARTIERILTPAMRARIGSLLADIIVGGDKVLAGTATTPAGVLARGRTLTLRLTRPVADFPASWISGLCAVPPTLPADPEGAKSPLHSAGPYYVAEYIPNERVVVERNRYYKGERPHHVDRFVADLDADANSIVDETANGDIDWGPLTYTVFASRVAELERRYGRNRSQFFVRPGRFLRMFVLNASRPLFRNNVELRQAVNFAVDRRALVREYGPFAATTTDQYLEYRNARIYPLRGPDLRRARSLARGRRRAGKAVLYTTTDPIDTAQAQIMRRNLKEIGLTVEIVQFPGRLLFEKLATGAKAFDIGRIGWGNLNGPVDPSLLSDLFDGRTIGLPENINWSYFDSPKYNRLLRQASRLTGDERYRAYAQLDVQLSRDAAPAIPVAFSNSIAFVSARVGCIVLNPFLDLTAVCLK